LYFVGSFALLALAGCGGGWLMEQREPWRHEAEVACLKSGAVKESPAIAQLPAINGPGVCGADFPLKVASLGEGAVLGFADDMRPPGTIPQYPPAVRRAPATPPYESYPTYPTRPQTYEAPYRPQAAEPPYRSRYEPPYQTSSPSYRAPRTDPGAPLSLRPPGVGPAQDEPEEIDQPPAQPMYGRRGAVTRGAPLPDPSHNPRPYPLGEGPYVPPASQPPEPYYTPAPRTPTARGYPAEPVQDDPLPPLGPARGAVAAGPAAVAPAATLACPMVSALDQWITGSVQPAAMRWFGQPVAEIRQISAYSCRGMNGNRHARISEHAFGNALDISAFTLADGRKVTVKDGWRGLPEERGFLRDVHAAACQQFSTVLGPGSNVYHADHLHLDLMRRSSGRSICNPAAVPGDLVAGRRGDIVTGSVGKPRTGSSVLGFAADAPRASRKTLPAAVPGED
jgi:hypothetical protein